MIKIVFTCLLTKHGLEYPHLAALKLLKLRQHPWTSMGQDRIVFCFLSFFPTAAKTETYTSPSVNFTFEVKRQTAAHD